jgi:hypothetical protein
VTLVPGIKRELGNTSINEKATLYLLIDVLGYTKGINAVINYCAEKISTNYKA